MTMQRVPLAERPPDSVLQESSGTIYGAMAEHGWHFVREHYKWGSMLSFEKGKYWLMLCNGRWLDAAELYEYLVENWVPVARDDVDYKLYRMRAEFELTGQK